MFVKLCLAICLAAFVSSASVYESVLDAVKCECPRRQDLDVSEVEAYIYNFETGYDYNCPLSEAADRIKNSTDFNSDQCIHVFVPGFLNNIGSEVPREVLCALSDYECNSMNVILVIIDSSAYISGSSLEKLNVLYLFERAVTYSKSISYALGKFFSSILEVIPKDRLYGAGHSLGAQIVSKAAEFSDELGKRVANILLIDAAGPCFENCLTEHARSGQADNVVSVHCNSGGQGTYLNLTDYDFYSRDGVTQEGCFSPVNSVVTKLPIVGGIVNDVEASNCSHYKCVPIALQTAIDPSKWQATKCDSFENFKNGNCDGNYKTMLNYGKNTTGPSGGYFFNSTGNLQCEISIY